MDGIEARKKNSQCVSAGFLRVCSTLGAKSRETLSKRALQARERPMGLSQESLAHFLPHREKGICENGNRRRQPSHISFQRRHLFFFSLPKSRWMGVLAQLSMRALGWDEWTQN